MLQEPLLNRLFLLISFMIGSQLLSAQTVPSIFDHMQGQEVVKVELRTNISDFIANRRNADYIPAEFIFTDHDGTEQNLDIKIRVRGKYRRVNCDLSPIKLNFDKDELADMGFSTIDKYKMITHCLASDKGDDIVLREHLIYQLHNLVSPYSFRTQLIEVTYYDTGSGDRSTHYGVIIENKEEMARRLGGAVCEDCYGTNRKFDTENMLQTSVFQYMIGNMDWSIAKQKNVKILNAGPSDVFQVVTYDFDFSALVNPPYYAPQPELGIVGRERYYRGLACTEEQMLDCLDHFKALEIQIIATVDDHPRLSKASKMDIKRYLGSFFTQIRRNSGHKKIKGIAYL